MLSDELINKIGADLDVLPLQPTSRRELEMLVSRVYSNIRSAQERGATYTEIARQISTSGYPIKRSTLCAALMRHRKNVSGAKHPVRLGETNSTPARRLSVATASRPRRDERSSRAPSGDSRPRRQSSAGPSQ